LGAVPGLLLAQADRATIQGIVTDASGASIVAATVKTLRIETNDVIQLKTNEIGPILPCEPAPRDVPRHQRERGFSHRCVDNLVLQSQMSVRADVKLTIGQVTA
jgi:hypothetical protein